MPDTKITALTAIGANPIIPSTFPIPMVDLTDTSMAASGTTKKVTVNQILGAGGTATLASATITGDLTVDTNTLKVDSANDRVGVGTASPASQFHIFNSGATTDTYLEIQNGTASTYIGTRGTAFGAMDAGDSYIFNSSGNDVVLMAANASGAIKFAAGGSTESMRLNSTGNLAFPTGKGIDFSATTEGGAMTSELLNDYEEGEWTGTLKGSTSDPTTPVTATGKYTKIGRQVTVQISFISVNTTGASSRILVSGLPFAASSSPNGVTGSVLTDLAATFTGSPAIYLGPSATQLDLYSSVSNGAVASVTHNAGTARSLWLNVTYTV